MDATILLIEPNEILRKGIGCALGSSGRAAKVLEASDERGALEILERVRVDAVIIDEELLNGEDGLIDRVVESSHVTRSIIVDASTSEPPEPRAKSGTSAGAETVRSMEGLWRALEQPVRAGSRNPGRPSLPGRPGAGRAGLASGALAALTRREVAVLKRISEGSTNREVAEALGITRRTVDSHRCHLMRKLDIHKTAGLVRLAVREGLIEP